LSSKSFLRLTIWTSALTVLTFPVVTLAAQGKESGDGLAVGIFWILVACHVLVKRFGDMELT
jgi:hypothetical protein